MLIKVESFIHAGVLDSLAPMLRRQAESVVTVAYLVGGAGAGRAERRLFWDSEARNILSLERATVDLPNQSRSSYLILFAMSLEPHLCQSLDI